MISPEEIKEIRKLVDAATRGPWQSCNGDNFAGSCIEGIHYQNRVDVIVDDGLYDQHKVGVRKREDAVFIAAARTLVPRLLDEVEKLKQAMHLAVSNAGKDLIERNENLEADHKELVKALKHFAEIKPEHVFQRVSPIGLVPMEKDIGALARTTLEGLRVK